MGKEFDYGMDGDKLEDEVTVDPELNDKEKTQPQSSSEPVIVAGIRFKKNGKTYYFDPAGFDLKKDDRVIIDTVRGVEYGYVVLSNRTVRSSEVVQPLRRVLRMADAEDTARHEANLVKEVEAFNICLEKIEAHKLDMKLIDVEYAFDNSKLLFSFSAEGRVDFRELVRDLAGVFHTRIELRQIGIRDEAKILGGLGICGRPFCCSSFLSDFVQVSVKMAKEQNLSLNSAKISGSCGRLMCCLRYEYDAYIAEKEVTPKVDTVVMTPDGEGVIVEANPMAGIVKVRLNSKKDDDPGNIYVREDVVPKDKYDGRILKKSELPLRVKRASEKINILDYVSPFSEIETKAVRRDQNDKDKNDKDKKEVASSGAEKSEIKSEQSGNFKKIKEKDKNKVRSDSRQDDKIENIRDNSVNKDKNRFKNKQKNRDRQSVPDKTEQAARIVLSETPKNTSDSENKGNVSEKPSKKPFKPYFRNKNNKGKPKKEQSGNL